MSKPSELPIWIPVLYFLLILLLLFDTLKEIFNNAL